MSEKTLSELIVDSARTGHVPAEISVLDGLDGLTASSTDLNRTASATAMRAFISDTRAAVTLSAQAYTTVLADLDKLLEVTTGSSAATITLISAITAGDNAVQQIRKADTGAGAVVILSGTTVVGYLASQGETCVLRSDGTNWRALIYRAQSGILKTSAVAIPNTGNTNENVLVTVPLPAGLLGTNGTITVDSTWSMTNNGNVKTAKLRLGGGAGTAVGTATLTSAASARVLWRFQNRGAANSQVFFVGGTGTGTSGSALGTSSFDTSVAADLVITAQLATGTDTMTLEAYTIRLEV